MTGQSDHDLIFFRGRPIRYRLRYSRARHPAITVYPDGSVVAAVPIGYGVESVQDFVVRKSSWILRAMKRVARAKSRPILETPPGGLRRFRHSALALVMKKIHFWNSRYKFDFRKIAVKNQMSRWGSCSPRGNLNFNYRILFLPETLQDYLIVHELCHLAEANHSSRFWRLAQQTIPDARERGRELARILIRTADKSGYNVVE